MSVIVVGRYRGASDTPERQSARVFAHTLLKRNGVW
jgi:hypothetical protein